MKIVRTRTVKQGGQRAQDTPGTRPFATFMPDDGGPRFPHVPAAMQQVSASVRQWLIVVAGIARVEFRRLYGYAMVFAIPWFVLGVVLFTLLPA